MIHIGHSMTNQYSLDNYNTSKQNNKSLLMIVSILGGQEKKRIINNIQINLLKLRGAIIAMTWEQNLLCQH